MEVVSKPCQDRFLHPILFNKVSIYLSFKTNEYYKKPLRFNNTLSNKKMEKVNISFSWENKMICLFFMILPFEEIKSVFFQENGKKLKVPKRDSKIGIYIKFYFKLLKNPYYDLIHVR